MNDTSTRYHHGCARVVRLLIDGLARHGVQVIARSPARNDWEHDKEFLAALARADVIVINGEGTLHHGKADGEKLLRIATHPARGATPIALINALYEDNPPEWDARLSQIALLSARDSDSARALSDASGHQARWVPDLSLSAPAEIPASPRHGVLVGDSVRLDRRRHLAQAAARLPDARVIPTKTLGGALWRLPLIGTLARGLLYRIYNGTCPTRIPPFRMAPDEAAYLREIASARLHITGRFHAVCLSMLTETPFLALTSNASKIERLLTDAGLGDSRMISASTLQTPPEQMDFTADELRLIRAFLHKAQTGADRLFADIAVLARLNARPDA
ncbi:polysaccharide pyruvyl transferase family protein [Thalassovita taeanensis]|nr:polysaccharide pyruvyl transferase family protein [Thalassovita taeanensis]